MEKLVEFWLCCRVLLFFLDVVENVVVVVQLHIEVLVPFLHSLGLVVSLGHMFNSQKSPCWQTFILLLLRGLK